MLEFKIKNGLIESSFDEGFVVITELDNKFHIRIKYNNDYIDNDFDSLIEILKFAENTYKIKKYGKYI